MLDEIQNVKEILFQRAGVLHRCVALTLAPLSHSFSAKRATSWRWCPTVCSWRPSWPLISSAFPPQREVTIAQTDKSHNFLMYTRKPTSPKQTFIFTMLTFCKSHEPHRRQTSTLPCQALLWMYGGGRVLCHCMYAFIIHNTVQHLITMSHGRKLRIMTEVTCYKLVRNFLLKGTDYQNKTLLWHISVSFDHCWNILQQIR